MVEKPLALTVKEGAELVSLAEKKKLILMVGHILQFHPAVIKLKEIIKNRELGSIRYLYSNRLNIGKLRTEENVLWSFAPHDISLILMFMEGEEPKQVLAYGGAYINKNICDTTLTVLEFDNGVKGHIFVSWLHPYKEQKLVVVGSEKMAVFDDLSMEKLYLYPHTIEWNNGNVPVAHKADFFPVKCERKQPLREELLHFLDCIKFRKIPKTSGKEGLQVLKILEKAEKSLIINMSKSS
jgi:UDP-2-acetamido-3-amino-2,3-dideoxy-glucuronate N-acetyltransferase